MVSDQRSSMKLYYRNDSAAVKTYGTFKTIIIFEDEDLLLNNTWPEFSPCFQNTLLVWVPCGWVWLSLPVYLYYLCKYSNGITIPVNKLNVGKTLVSLVLAALALVDTLKAEPDPRRDTDKVADAVYLAGGIKAATYVSMTLSKLGFLKPLRSRGYKYIY
ncbi:multidrug resistance-associated protein 1 [Elysia marginata]|uniref:Multidrug resistance-associated protein 1 n=1 Tax=Elysia marginata TaxID=1093978 RepID=A0AAV4HMZ2_9GAST|nr:multidrug resistance-associated protein 1 [Elysia marginata]